MQSVENTECGYKYIKMKMLSLPVLSVTSWRAMLTALTLKRKSNI